MNNSSNIKLCECGCGEPAPIAKQTVKKQGWVKGWPKRFVRYHNINHLPHSEHGVNANGGYCECGCGHKTKVAAQTLRTQGYVKGEHLRFLKGHHLRKSATDYAVAPDTGCWIWQRTIIQSKSDRYGQMWKDGRKQYAHRAYYESEYGLTPSGCQIHHLCVEHGFGTTLCVNPAHLRALSGAENSRINRKLTAEDVIEIHRMLDDPAFTQRQIAETFGVHPNHISSINTGHRWSYGGLK